MSRATVSLYLLIETDWRNLRDQVDQCSDSFHDEGTADFLTGLMEAHEKMSWMLRSFIEGQAIESSDTRPRTDIQVPAGVS